MVYNFHNDVIQWHNKINQTILQLLNLFVLSFNLNVFFFRKLIILSNTINSNGKFLIIFNSNSQCTTNAVLFYIGLLQQAYCIIHVHCSLGYYCEIRRPHVIGFGSSLTPNKAINADPVYRRVTVCSIVSNSKHIKTQQAFYSVWQKMVPVFH